ncbi:hypothetical protein P7C71_g5262, partial [Lecanoromycetidae sp. Uapishka_2]
MAAGADVYADWREWAPLCGQMIEIGEPDRRRVATLGGVVKVLSSDATSKLYGMTAGHVVTEEPILEEEDLEPDKEDDSDDEEQGFQDEEELQLEVDIDLDEGLGVHGVGTEPTGSNSWQHTRQEGPWPLIGHISAISDAATGPDLDWALIDFDNIAAQLLSNVFTIPGSDPRISRDLQALACEPMMDDPDRDVVLVSGSSGLKPGKVSTTTSYLNMGHSKRSAETYNLSLYQNLVLNPGDCGSWVVDKETYEVYGHVVAVDALGEAYIVPLNATLRDMKRQLAAYSVSLPTKADVQQPYELRDASDTSRTLSLMPSNQRYPAPPAPPAPNPFESPAAVERLKADISHPAGDYRAST